MKTATLLLGLALIVPGLGFAGSYAQKAKTMKQMDIVDTAASAGSFSTLVAAIKAAGLVDTLKGAFLPLPMRPLLSCRKVR
jgi:hypothetical protein